MAAPFVTAVVLTLELLLALLGSGVLEDAVAVLVRVVFWATFELTCTTRLNVSVALAGSVPPLGGHGVVCGCDLRFAWVFSRSGLEYVGQSNVLKRWPAVRRGSSPGGICDRDEGSIINDC